jgi:hypothetical protein
MVAGAQAIQIIVTVLLVAASAAVFVVATGVCCSHVAQIREVIEVA